MTCGTVTEDTSVGNQTMTNPGNVVNVAGGTPALVDWSTGVSTGSRIKCHNLPAGSNGIDSDDSIDGISFYYYRSEDGTSDNIGTMEIYPIDSGGSLVTTTNSSETGEWETGNDTTMTQYTVGGASNKMGYNSVTANDVLDSDFGISVRAWTTNGTSGTNDTGTTPDGQMAEFRVKIFYTEDGAVGGGAAQQFLQTLGIGN